MRSASVSGPILVDALGAGEPLVVDVGGFVDHRYENAVGDESGAVFGFHRDLADEFTEIVDGLVDRIGSL